MLAASHDAAAGKSRSAEQQRRTANRERCRDAFFAWVRQVSYETTRYGPRAVRMAVVVSREVGKS